MTNEGWEDEVREILARALDPDAFPGDGIAYRKTRAALEKADCVIARLRAAGKVIEGDWQDISEAPTGTAHPYAKGPDAATYVLIDNGHHIGVGWGESDGLGTDWWGEDSQPVEPPPIRFKPLPVRSERQQ